MDWLKSLMHSRKFWLAVFGVVQSVVFSILPQFPTELWAAIDGLVAVLISMIAVEDFAAKSSNGGKIPE